MYKNNVLCIYTFSHDARRSEVHTYSVSDCVSELLCVHLIKAARFTGDEERNTSPLGSAAFLGITLK